MKGIVITPQSEVTVQDFGKPLYETTAEVTGGFEIVNPRRLPRPFCMIVDDNGLLKENPQFNPIGSFFYETHKHGAPIVGTIVLLKMGNTLNGPDIIGLTDADVQQLLGYIELTKLTLHRKEAAHEVP